MNDTPTIPGIIGYFAVLSLMMIGGAGAVIPDMHRHLVDVHHWMSDTEFVELVALSQAAPGPNVLIVSLLGWRIAGLGGALAATAATVIPSSLLAYCFARFWQRFQHAPWRKIVQTALAWVTIGLILASGYVLTRAADHTWAAFAITAATVVLVVKTKIHPLLLLAGAGCLGYFGLV